MLPAGAPTEDTINTLSNLLEAGDTIIDGGNTFYKDDIRRAKTLSEKGLHYIDVGTSGGVWGLERGYCMMIGGDAETVSASIRCSPPGAGHGRHSAHQGPQSDDPAPSTATSMPARGCRALREDDSQRHRVRHDAGLRRRLRHSQDQGSTTCRKTSVST
jgi:hypothetical protein